MKRMEAKQREVMVVENRKRNTALLLIAAGAFLLFGNIFGFFTITAFLILFLGIYKLRADGGKMGYLLIAIAAIMLLNSNMIIILSLILIACGYILLTTKQLPKVETYVHKQNILESIRWDREQWIFRNTSITCLIAEAHLDLSLAILEDELTTLVLQGLVGHVEIIVPEDLGLKINTNLLIGQLELVGEKEAGFFNKTSWQSPNYLTSTYNVELNLSFVVGEIKVRRL